MSGDPSSAPHRLLWPWLVGMVGLGVVLPLWPALVSGGVPGGGPDVVATLWGMWWFQQEGAAMPLGGETLLVNHPFGAHGVVLSPLTAGTWAVLEPLVGVGRASSLVVAGVVLATAAAVGLLARTVGAGWTGATIAAGSMLVGRYLLFGAGEGSVVAISNVPLPLGLAALAWLLRGRGRWGSALALTLCTTAVAAENPYLAPLLPLVTGAAVTVRAWRARGPDAAGLRALGGAVLGGLGVLGVAAVFGEAASPDYPREVAGTLLTLGDWEFTVVDLPWARVRPLEVLWGGAVRWTVDADGGVAAGGGRTLGVGVLLLAVLGAVLQPRARVWIGLAAVSLVVSLGSLVGDVGTPFLYLNTLMASVARPLTQPVRFLAVAQVALAVAAGLGAEALHRHRGGHAAVVILGCLLLECLLLGAGTLRLPVTDLPEADCVRDLDPGAALVLPWDARDGEPSRSQLLQLLHGRPGVHPGIASWRQAEESATEALRSMGVHSTGPRPERLALGRLDQHGYRWVVVDEEADPGARAVVRPQLGSPVAECDGFSVFDIRKPALGPVD